MSTRTNDKSKAKAKAKAKAKSSRSANTFDGILATLTPPQQAALQRLRRQIAAVVPAAGECVKYGVPAFQLNGKFLVGLGANGDACSFYPGAAVGAFGDLLKGYDTGKGTVRFTPDKPLPATLVRQLVKARLALGGFVGTKQPATTKARARPAKTSNPIKKPRRGNA